MPRFISPVAAVLFLLSACSEDSAPQRDSAPSAFQKDLQTRFINARAGDGLKVNEGKNIVIRNNRAEYNVAGIEVADNYDPYPETIYVYDNRFSGDDGKLRAELAICVDNDDAEVLNVDLGNDSANIVVGEVQHSCQHEKLPAVVLAPTWILTAVTATTPRERQTLPGRIGTSKPQWIATSAYANRRRLLAVAAVTVRTIFIPASRMIRSCCID